MFVCVCIREPADYQFKFKLFAGPEERRSFVSLAAVDPLRANRTSGYPY